MCAEHSPPTIDLAGRPLSHEFAGLGLERLAPYHCDACRHAVRGRLWALTIVGGLASVVGVLEAIVGGLTLGIAIACGGTFTAVLSHWIDQRRKAAAIAVRTVLPLVPSIDAVSVRESLDGSLRLDAEGNYETPVAPVDGVIKLSMSLGKADRDRLRSYRRKYGLSDQQDIEFSAGFAVLYGEAGLELAPHASGLAPIAPSRTVIPLRGKVGEYPSFVSSDRRTARPWKLDFQYSLQEARKCEKMPIWLTPTLVPEADQRTLALDLQWTEFGPEDNPLVLDRIEHLTLKVPVLWGNVEGVRERALLGMEIAPASHPSRRDEHGQRSLIHHVQAGHAGARRARMRGLSSSSELTISRAPLRSWSRVANVRTATQPSPAAAAAATPVAESSMASTPAGPVPAARPRAGRHRELACAAGLPRPTRSRAASGRVAR